MNGCSAQEFIRALRATSDPPPQSNKTKIEIARDGWDTPSFNFPQKTEFIVSWLLTRLLKGKDTNDIDDNPVFDARYWSLLADVLSVPSPRPIKVWLAPILNTTPIVPFLSKFFDVVVPRASEPKILSLGSLVHKSLLVLWPLVVPKLSADTLLDCFLAMVKFFHQNQYAQDNNSFLSLALMVTGSLRESFVNASNKKKLFLVFIESDLYHWLHCIPDSLPSSKLTPESSIVLDSFREEVYSAGEDVLFSPENLYHSPLSQSEIFHIPESGYLFPFRNISIDDIPPYLPRFFNSFIRAFKKHKSTSSSSPYTETTMQMRYFNECDDWLSKADGSSLPVAADKKVEIWRVRLALLEVVHQENIYRLNVTTAGGEGSEEFQALARLTRIAVDTLRPTWSNDLDPDVVCLVVEVLSSLCLISHEYLIDPLLPYILPRLSLIHPAAYRATRSFLGHLLSYYSKTRTLNVYINSLITSLSFPADNLSPVTDLPSRNSPFAVLIPGASEAQPDEELTHAIYSIAHAGPPLSSPHLGDLARSIRAFCVPGSQTDAILTSVRSALDKCSRKALQPQLSGAPERPRKRRKVSPDVNAHNGGGDRGRGREMIAISYTLISRLACTILPSLPPSAISLSVHIFHEVNGDLEVVLRQSLSRLNVVNRKTSDERDLWVEQILAAACLRLEGSVGCLQRRNTTCKNADEDDLSRMTEMMHVVESAHEQLPELVVEVFQYLLRQSSRCDANGTTISADRLIASLLNYLEQYLVGPGESHSAIWRGLACQLDIEEGGSGHRRVAVALLHVILDQWLPLLDERASTEQLRIFAQYLTEVHSWNEPFQELPQESGGLTARLVWRRTLRSAEFWELQNLRNAILITLNARIAPLDNFDVEKQLLRLSSPKKKKKPPMTVEELKGITRAYEFLLLSPVEYMSRQFRSDALRRAVCADIAIRSVVEELSEMEQVKEPQTDDGIQWRAIFRIFVRRVTAEIGWNVNLLSPQYLTYMMDPSNYHFVPSTDMLDATVGLAEVAYGSLLRLAQKNSDDVVVSIIHDFIRLSPFSTSFTAVTEKSHIILQQGILRLISVLTTLDISLSQYPERTQGALKALRAELSATLAPQMSMTILDHYNLESLYSRQPVFEAWCHLLALDRWLGQHAGPMNLGVGSQLLTSLIKLTEGSSIKVDTRTHVGDIGATVLAVVVEEIQSSHTEDRLSLLAVVTAAYVYAARSSDAKGTGMLDLHIARVCKALSPTHFGCLLDLVLEGLACPGKHEDDATSLVHLSSVLLREAPESTSKLSQAHMSDCLHVFQRSPMFYFGTQHMRIQLLSCISRQCNERPATVNPLDIGCMWSLLCKLLSGSREHDDMSSPAIFHEIISITSALIRHRRDLVTCTLPHLGVILIKLTLSIRGVRPQLGSKQSKIVTDTLPKWINPLQLLGAEEAKALARLLTALTTKSIVRTQGSASAVDGHKEKAESLARPFSKHAPYVLMAFIEAVNDPLCLFPANTRRELEPGLFALCEMITDNGRDAIMVAALDAGGKATLKTLWKAYEKQRYVGQG